MSGKAYFTESGWKKIQEELTALKTKDRPEIAAAIEEAREKGDLRENAEYKAAKEAQSLLETKILKLEMMLANAVIIDETNIDTSKVVMLSTVKVKNLQNNKEQKFTIVPEKEANIKEGKISVDSPVGTGLLGKKPGEMAEIKVPRGVMKYEVLEITAEF